MKKILIILFLILCAQAGFSQTKRPIKTILTSNPDSTNSAPILPGDYDVNFSPEQDSAFKKAIRLNIPAGSRFLLDLKRFAGAWESAKNVRESSPWAYANNNINIPTALLTPRSFDVTQRQISIFNSLYVPGMNAYDPNRAVTSFDAIGQFLGLAEDVSPIIRYTLDYSDDVEVVVYSMQAQVIAVLYKGVQPAGKYSYTWNFRSSKGMRMPPGDYIAEVRIGNSRYVRKRIVLGH